MTMNSGNLYLTTLGRVVLDGPENRSENFHEGDIVILTKDEIQKGLYVEQFLLKLGIAVRKKWEMR